MKVNRSRTKIFPSSRNCRLRWPRWREPTPLYNARNSASASSYLQGSAPHSMILLCCASVLWQSRKSVTLWQKTEPQISHTLTEDRDATEKISPTRNMTGYMIKYSYIHKAIMTSKYVWRHTYLNLSLLYQDSTNNTLQCLWGCGHITLKDRFPYDHFKLSNVNPGQ